MAEFVVERPAIVEEQLLRSNGRQLVRMEINSIR